MIFWPAGCVVHYPLCEFIFTTIFVSIHWLGIRAWIILYSSKIHAVVWFYRKHALDPNVHSSDRRRTAPFKIIFCWILIRWNTGLLSETLLFLYVVCFFLEWREYLAITTKLFLSVVQALLIRFQDFCLFIRFRVNNLDEDNKLGKGFRRFFL